MLAINRIHDIYELHTFYGMTVDITYVLHKQPAYDYSKAYDLSSKLQPYAHTILVICHTIRNTYAHTIIVICHTILHVKSNRTQRTEYGMPYDSVRTNRTFLQKRCYTYDSKMAYEKSYARPFLSAPPS